MSPLWKFSIADLHPGDKSAFRVSVARNAGASPAIYRGERFAWIEGCEPRLFSETLFIMANGQRRLWFYLGSTERGIVAGTWQPRRAWVIPFEQLRALHHVDHNGHRYFGTMRWDELAALERSWIERGAAHWLQAIDDCATA